MRILHISSARTWRGGEQQIAYLIDGLQKKDCQQWVCCPKNAALEAYCRKHQIPVVTYRKGFSVNPIPAFIISKIVQQHQIELIHIHDSHAHTFGCMAASFFGVTVPMILSRRVDFPIQKNSLSKWKYNHPSIRSIICVSHFIKTILAKDIDDPTKIEVVHSGIDLGKFTFKNTNILRSEFNIDPQTKIIANVAAIAPHKDYFTFVDTVEILIKEKLNAIFLIIGADGGQEEKIKSYIKNKNLDQHIILTGFRNDIPQILPEVDLFLFTSKTEGLGTSLLDAMAYGVPIVATDAGGIPEIVIDGETGLSAGVKDAMSLANQVKRMFGEEELRGRLVGNARGRLGEFSKERMAEKTHKIYNNILKSPTKRYNI